MTNLLRASHLIRAGAAGSVLALLLLLVAMAGTAYAQAPEPHQYIQEYSGPETCEVCHAGIAEEMLHSVHYSWAEKFGHYSPIAGTIADINWLGILNEKLGIPGGCGRCHVGAGALPVPPQEATAEDRAQLDCLVCHSPNYDFGLRFPTQTEDGQWVLTQDRSLIAARNAQRPTTDNCLRCHLNSGGAGELQERGVDFAPVSDKHGATSTGDVHATAGMVCVDCHRAPDHKILGFGPTLWSRDRPDQRLLCDSCHGSEPHSDAILNLHTRVDCRTCHIPSTGGLVARDWTAEPTYDPVNELYSPVDDVRDTNTVDLEYRWFNGDPAYPEEPWPGDRTGENSRLQPFKRFDGRVPADARSGQPIPLKLSFFYTEGDLEKAILAGAAESEMSYSGDWEPMDVTTYLQISHGVASKDQALNCQDCHVPDGKLDFASLGYRPAEVGVFTTLSAPSAGPRRDLRIEVLLPASEPLPMPDLVSGETQAASAEAFKIPFNPILVGLATVAMLAVGGFWFWRQRPGA